MPDDLIETDPDFMPPLGDAWGPLSFGKQWDDGRPPEVSDWRRGRMPWLIIDDERESPDISAKLEHIEWIKATYLRPNIEVQLQQQSLIDWLPVFEALRPCPVVADLVACTDIGNPQVLAAMSNVLELTLRECDGMTSSVFHAIGGARPRWTCIELNSIELPESDALCHLASLPLLNEVELFRVTLNGSDLKAMIDAMGDRLTELTMRHVIARDMPRGELWKLSPKIRFDT